MIITIDGPAGTGKTTVAKRVADALQFLYFDTGAMYRAVTWMMLEEGILIKDIPAIENLLKRMVFQIREDEEGRKHYYVQGIDVTDEIRTPKVTEFVSPVSALKPVRDALMPIQKNFAQSGDCVFEGRDMGTVVFPNADVKVFLTARPEIRAERRLKEFQAKMPNEVKGLSHDEILKEIMRRDEIDSTRAISPLRCPEDAFTVDTSDLTIDEVVESILDHIEGRE